jgi:glycosyltransferase EpsF
MDRNQYQFDFVVFSNKQGDFDQEIIELGGKLFVIAPYSNPIKRMLALKNY